MFIKLQKEHWTYKNHAYKIAANQTSENEMVT